MQTTPEAYKQLHTDVFNVIASREFIHITHEERKRKLEGEWESERERGE